MKQLVARTAVVVVLGVGFAACAGNPPVSTGAVPEASRFAEYPTPDIPATLQVAAEVRTRHESGWRRLQAGDLRGATRDFNAVLDDAPGFYPAETALGFVELANRRYKNAEPRFDQALRADSAYLPALVGRAEALLGLERDAEAIAAMERVLAVDPQRESVRTRLELVRFRRTQMLLASAQQAAEAGRHDEAARHYQDALALSPQSTMILQGLVASETAAGNLEAAERYARQAVDVEPGQAAGHAALGDVLEARGQFAAAAEAYARADRLESTPERRDRLRVLRERAEMAALPSEFARIATADAITRGDVAAFIGIHLRSLVEGAPARVSSVATDVRTHWAAPWILPVARAGIMTVFPNHTFQPGTAVRRGDLATVAENLVRLAAAGRRAELARWQAARPRFVDLPPSNVFYGAAALAVSANVMAPDATGRFNPTRPATGAELDAMVRRIAELAGP